MNKYQEALEEASLCCLCTDTAEEANEYLIVLKELVDKATPKKPKKEFDDIICPHCNAEFNVCDNCTEMFMYCPNCGGNFTGKLLDYCYHCGQAIDWSDEES